MDYLYNVKDVRTGMYYSNDREFMEPNKKFAKKMGKGQAQAIIRNCMRYKAGSQFSAGCVLEKV